MRTGAPLAGLALIASSLPGAAAAQQPNLEVQLVQAFQTYCIASAADPKRVSVKLHDFYWNSAGWITKGLDLVITKEPYSRVRVLFDEPPGYPRTCKVDVTPTLIDKQVVLATLERDLSLGTGTSTVLPEIKPKEGLLPRSYRPKTELTLWKTRLDDTEAEIKFSVPAGAGTHPSLMLSVGAK